CALCNGCNWRCLYIICMVFLLSLLFPQTKRNWHFLLILIIEKEPASLFFWQRVFERLFDCFIINVVYCPKAKVPNNEEQARPNNRCELNRYPSNCQSNH